jgi:hypothetical protein
VSEEEKEPLTPEEIKRRFPVCTGIVDEFRALFGPGVRARYFKEGDQELGKPGKPGVPLTALGFDPNPDRPETKPRPPSRRRWKDMVR